MHHVNIQFTTRDLKYCNQRPVLQQTTAIRNPVELYLLELLLRMAIPLETLTPFRIEISIEQNPVTRDADNK